MKDRHVDGKWTDIPDPPVQAEVLDWWFRFHEDFCSEERRRYYSTTSPKDLVGAEAQRQIDLFVKRKNGQPPDAAHDWRDVDVIGELKASNNNKKATLLQLGRYVRDVFSCQPTRRPGAFDIHEKPERFIQVIAGYTMMNDEELGLDIFTDRDGDGRLIHIEQDGASGRKRMRLDSQPFTHQRAIVCRGTSCYLTKPSDAEDWSCVAKLSWTSDRRKPEADFLRLAQQRGVEGIANSQRFGQGQDEVTYDVEEVQGTSLLAPTNGPYDNRVFRCLVISPAGRAIHKHKKISELLGALRDAIKAHRSLYLKGNILHRDISENNIIITDSKTTGHMGMLIDLDLARELGSGRSGARCRTGTMEFMAIEVLQGISHTYRHDLESFLGGLFVGTPKDPEILYEPIIKAFGKAIDDIMAMEG
ncbi:kinase [Hirsutella rhossiliensis]